MTFPILITGAAQGLGAALTQTLIHPQQSLILLDHDLESLQSLYDTLDEQFPQQIFLYPMDLKGATPQDYQNLAKTLSQQFSGLQALYLNAAELSAFTPIEYLEINQWYQTLQVNLNANFHLIQNLLPLLKQAPNSQIIAIHDQTIEQYPAFYGAYGVAKAGLKQLLYTLAAEHHASSQHRLQIWIAQPPAFQSNLRAKLFPGADLTNDPTPQTIAQKLVQGLKSSSSIPWLIPIHQQHQSKSGSNRQD